MIQVSWLIVAAMLDGASFEQAVELARKVVARERVTLAIHRGGKWIASPFDWTPTMRTALLYTADVTSWH